MEKLWTTTEVASYLGITEVDVEQLVRTGVLTGYKLGGEFLRFRPDQVAALKGNVKFRPSASKSALTLKESWARQLRDFAYFYDFYIISALLLGVLLVYLIAAG